MERFEREKLADAICQLADILYALSIEAATNSNHDQEWFINYSKCLIFVDKYFRGEKHEAKN